MTSATNTGTSETRQQTDKGTQQTDSGQTDKTTTGWKAPASQDELDRIIQDRLTRERAKFADYDDLKKIAEQHQALVDEYATDQEKAVSKARKEATDEVAAKAIPRVVRAEFRAAAKDVLDKAQLDALLEDLDLTKYAGPDGEPDEVKIAAKIAALAPKQTGFPDLGGGQRGGTSKTLNMNDLIRQQAGHGT